MQPNKKQKTEMSEKMSKMNEIMETVPVLFAKSGDLFQHRLDDRVGELDVFRYEGRTSDNWLIFYHIDGPGLGIINGGVRDAFGAFPIADYKVDEDPNRLKLPHTQCYAFRKVGEALGLELSYPASRAMSI